MRQVSSLPVTAKIFGAVNAPSVYEFQQDQNVNPQNGHEMPIPAGDVQQNQLRLRRTMQQRSEASNQQSHHAAEQVRAVHAGQEINERAAGRRGNIETAGGKF